MNIYGVIGLVLSIAFLGHFFELGPAFEQFATRLADIPTFEDKGDNQTMFTYATRLAYLIAIVGVVKVIISRPKDDG